nr:MAG TPA: hypothetical protein [Caudoviricetes sp.]
MTNDYKEKLLKWISGNYQIETGTNSPQFTTPLSRTNNFATLFSSQFPNGYFLSTALQGYNADNNGVGYTLIAGSYYIDDTATTMRGFVTILDNDFDIVQTITQYSSGTYLGIFEAINVGTDGNFFGIENNNGIKRFVMLNNIIAKLPSETEYKVVLRQSYNVPDTSKLYSASVTGIIKAPGIAKYCVYGNYFENPSRKPLVTEIEVNVGSTNNWIDYTYSGDVEFYASDCLPSWNKNGDLSFKMVGIENIGSGTNNYAFCMYSTTGVTTLTRQQIGSGLGVGKTMDMKILTANDIYACFSEFGSTSMNLYMYKVNVSNYTLNTFYTKNTPIVESEYNSGIAILKNGAELFYSVSANKDTTPTKTLYYFGKVIGSQAYEYYLGEFDPSLTNLFSVQKQFNLYDYYMQVENVVYDMKQVYNPLNYNGLPYQALNSMVPNSVNIYDPNGVVIFARNLYNRIVNNNTTISTVEVPNDFMNDVTIQLKELISQTNNVMVSDSMEIVKNVYEELLINFVNSIIVKNSNNINNVIINNTASNRINNSVSNPSVLDYNNSKIGKYKINYGNGTSVINPINTDLTFAGLSTNYIITVYVPIDYGITSIQLLSNDETTIYQTIDCSNLENNKYYTINQKMEVV